MKAQTGLKDILVIGDLSPDDPIIQEIGEIYGLHGLHMQGIITGMGVPLEKTVFRGWFGGYTIRKGNDGLQRFTSGNDEELRKKTRVVHVPYFLPFGGPGDLERIQQQDRIVFVTATNNMDRQMQGDRDIYNTNHRGWHLPNDPETERAGRKAYQEALKIHKTDKVIAATSARVTEEGEIEPNINVVTCGDIKETCFTMVPAQYTSTASARLSAIAFYLAQFWETPEEIVEVLRKCAVDIGEPGVDREYGSGMVNLLCPEVLRKEIDVVTAHTGETKKQVFTTEGGEVEGTWKVKNGVLKTKIPTVLEKTLEAVCTGTVNGTIDIKNNEIVTDITVKAEIQVVFLVPKTIEIQAEDTIQLKGEYTVDQGNTLSVPSSETSFTYTATEDSLHIVRNLTLDDLVRQLPGYLGEMAKKETSDIFADEPIQVIMSFAKIKLLGDFDGNNVVDFADFLLFVQTFGTTGADRAFNERMDLVPDGIINFSDFLVFVEQFGKTRDS